MFLSWGSSVGKVIRLLTTRSEVLIPVEARYFLFSKMFRSPVGPTQPTIPWVLEFFPGGEAVGA
jgi:hypothetical protein